MRCAERRRAQLTSVCAVSQRVSEARARRASVFEKGIERIQVARKAKHACSRARMAHIKQTDNEIAMLQNRVKLLERQEQTTKKRIKV